MPFSNLDLIEVTGKFLLLSGEPASGTLTFAADQTLIDSVADEIIVPVSIVAPLDSAGKVLVSLPATDDPDLAPMGWLYRVTESILGARSPRSYYVQIPVTAPGGTLDLADLVPIDPVDLVGTLAPHVEATGGGKEVVSIVANAGAAAILDLAEGNVLWVMNPVEGGTCTLTLAGATSGRACGCTVLFVQTAAGSSDLAFGGTVVGMNDGILPGPVKEPNAVAAYSLLTTDGGATILAWKVGESGIDVPDTVPGPPTAVVATAGDASASVAFSPPASNGGSAIFEYVATSTPGGVTGSGANSPIPVTGLTNGTAYTFTVHATNGVGDSAESVASNSVTPATVPGAPTIGVATPGDGTATLNWSAPASDGGSAITGYVAKLHRASDNVEIGSQSLGVVTTYQFGGLANGTAVYGKVAASNAVGTGALSAASNAVTPASGPTVPGTPTIGAATAGNAAATANWTAPGSNGGSAITGYEVKTYDGAGALLATDAVGVVLTFTKTGLTNGTAVKFKVAAVNAVGTGAQSAFSNTVTPTAPGFSDDFNRADGALGTSSSGHVWASTGMVIDANKARRNSPAGVADINSGLADFSLQWVGTNGGGAEMGCVFRKTDASNYWYGVVNGDNIYFLKIEAGALANMTSAVVVGSNTGTHTYKVTGVGTALKFYVDGVEKLAFVHAFNQTATRHGIGGGNVFATDVASTYDDVLCTTP